MKMIDEHINSLIQNIVKEIEIRNVDVVSLCDNLDLNPNEFINFFYKTEI